MREKQWQFLFHAACRIVPETARLDAAGRKRWREIIADAIEARPASVQRQLSAFLMLLRWATVARYGKPLDRLSGDRQDGVLRAFQDARISRLRQGMWGVKVLAFMGYYGQPEIAQTIGYNPSFNGNRKLHA